MRYRKNAPVKVGERTVRPDVVFTRARLAVFIDGCFWHGCSQHGAMPKTNASYWGPKLQRNQERDRATDSLLLGNGWAVARFWEHDDPWKVAEWVATALQTLAQPVSPISSEVSRQR